MAIDSCDHGDYIVCYEMGKTGCPVCDVESQNKSETTVFNGKIEGLESEVESLQQALREAGAGA